MADQTAADRRTQRTTRTEHTIESIAAQQEASARAFVDSLNAKLQDPEFRALWQQVQAAPTAAVRHAMVGQADQWLAAHHITGPNGKPLTADPQASFLHGANAYGLDANGQLTSDKGNWWSNLSGLAKVAIIAGAGAATAGAIAPAIAGAGAAGAAGGAGAGAAGTAGTIAATSPYIIGPSVAAASGGAAGLGTAGLVAGGLTAAQILANQRGGTTPQGQTPGQTPPPGQAPGPWARALGTYNRVAPLIGEAGQIAGKISQGRAQGRLLEATANQNAFDTESQAYDDAVKRALMGKLMQAHLPDVTTPENLKPYTANVSAGNSPDSTEMGKSLVSGAEYALAHPPHYDPASMNPQPNWIDKTLNIVAPVASYAALIGPYVRPHATTPAGPVDTSPGGENNLARTTGTAVPGSSRSLSQPGSASFLTGTELPPYAIPAQEQGLQYPVTDPSMAGVSFLPPRYQVPQAFKPRSYNFR